MPAWREASIADIADNGSNPGPDGLLDNGDFGLFIVAFFAANDDESGACDGSTIPCSPADITDNASMPGGDGFIDNGDFSAFIVSFFADGPRMARNQTPSLGLLSSVSTRPSGALNGLDWRHGFAGYLYDTHLGVYHVRARTYDPRLGRWLQRDPIGYAGGWNLYEYTEGDPLSDIDPTGEVPMRVAYTASSTGSYTASTGNSCGSSASTNGQAQPGRRRTPTNDPFRQYGVDGDRLGPLSERHEQSQKLMDDINVGEAAVGTFVKEAAKEAAIALATGGPWGAPVRGAVWAGRVGIGAKAVSGGVGAAAAGSKLSKIRSGASQIAATTGGRLTRAQKERIAEAAAAATMTRAGYTQLPSKLPGNRGIDQVWIKTAANGATRVKLVENKYNSSGALGMGSSRWGPQMSSGWVNATLGRMISQGGALKRTAEVISASTQVVKKANVCGPSGRNKWSTIP